MRIREATADDVPAVVRLLAADQLGVHREVVGQPLHRDYLDAFEAIDADPNNHLIVAEEDGEVIGTLQLSYLPGMSHRGAWRAQIEAVRIAESHRGGGRGQRLVLWAVDQARARGCRIVQVTSNKARGDAHRFYVQLGFHATHEGFKLQLA